MINLRIRKHRNSFVIVAVFVLLLLSLLRLESGRDSEFVSDAKVASDPPGINNIDTHKPESHFKSIDKNSKASIKDYTIFFKNLQQYDIKAPSIKNEYKTEKAAEIFENSDKFLFSKSYLENILDIPGSTFQKLKKSHEGYRREVAALTERIGLPTFGNILPSDPEWKNYEGSAGYVIVGGERYSWLAYLVIRQIRATGARLPIELFIANRAEYEKDFCEVILPRYNGRCNVFDSELTEDLKQRFGVGGFQYKMLAILSSKFENVLYLDSDNFPTRNVEYIFNSKLYKDKGLILWPDAWGRTTNPKYYDIAGVEVKENKIRYSKYDKKRAKDEGLEDVEPFSKYNFKNSHFHDFEGTIPNPTSEAGMFFVNKTKHVKTLLLSLYYNVFGPNFYYPLLTQGSAGEGDKETFVAAAHALGEPWFQTPKHFKWTGYFSEVDNTFQSKALGHYDPIQSIDGRREVDIIFMHLSYPKYYPNWLVDNNDLIYPDSNHRIRMYDAIYDNVGYDFDLRVLQFFTEGLCANYYNNLGLPVDGEPGVTRENNYMGNFLNYVKTDQEIELKRCSEVFLPHLEWLKSTTRYKDTNNQNVSN